MVRGETLTEMTKEKKQPKIRICAYCGKKFQSQRSRKYCDGPHYSKCKVCGKEFEIDLKKSEGYIKKTCSQKCAIELEKQNMKLTCQMKYGKDSFFQTSEFQEKAKITCLEKYGVENPMKSQEIQQKVIDTRVEKYGCEYLLQSEEILSKVKETNLMRYGVDNPFKSEDIKNKIKETNLTKYGVEYPSQSNEIVEKSKQTKIRKYGVDHPMKNEEYKEQFKKTMEEKYGVMYPCMLPQAREKTGMYSESNKNFEQILIDNNIEFTKEFPIENRQYDFKVGNILIEIDPTITHNTLMNPFSDEGISLKYHQDKTLLAQRNGYQCIHIFDWDNVDKVISLLKEPDEIIYARNCEVRNIDQKVCNEFEDQNHLQGHCLFQKWRYGLYNNDELVEVMTFGNPRYNKNYQFELMRLCSRIGVRVVGGASKLFHHFIEEHNPESIMSYCNLSKFSGSVYKELGMDLFKITEPSIIWSKENLFVTENQLRTRGFDAIFGTSYGKGTSNTELIKEAGYLPVPDCGQSVFVWKKSTT